MKAAWIRVEEARSFVLASFFGGVFTGIIIGILIGMGVSFT